MAGSHTRVQGTEVRDSGVKRSECAANPAGDRCYFIKPGFTWQHMTVGRPSGGKPAPRRWF
jgi:hypothetical protein